MDFNARIVNIIYITKKCLLIKGDFLPAMSCGYIVKIGNGTEL